MEHNLAAAQEICRNFRIFAARVLDNSKAHAFEQALQSYLDKVESGEIKGDIRTPIFDTLGRDFPAVLEAIYQFLAENEA